MSCKLSAWLTVGVCLLSPPLRGDPERPQGVSPGAVGSSERLGTSCPTFSWSGVSGAEGYELIVYSVGEDGELRTALTTEIPGGAGAWTPSASNCPDSGKRYAWAVRAMGGEGYGGWSEALLFETAGKPSNEEVRQALSVLRRHARSMERQGEPADSSAAHPSRASTEGSGLERDGSHSGSRWTRLPPLHRALTAETTGAPLSEQTVGSYPLSLSIDGDFDLGGHVLKEGKVFLHTEGGVKYQNTAVGSDALSKVTPGLPFAAKGRGNSAIGFEALKYTTSGAGNSALGSEALKYNVEGERNTAIGHQAMWGLGGGSGNTAAGAHALSGFFNSNYNTAVGFAALGYTSGSYNTAIGFYTGFNFGGDYNIAVGYGAEGSFTDSGTIRIGGGDLQTKAFIEGIRGATGASTFDEAVCTNSEEQLGPCSPSSLRFKRDVADMGETFGLLGALRPVTFRFKREEGGGSEEAIQYGLIAEEVAEVLPTLVSYDEEGRPSTVRYSLLTPLLLKEAQRQEDELAHLRGLSREVAELRQQMADRDRELADLRRRLEKLAAKKRL